MSYLSNAILRLVVILDKSAMTIVKKLKSEVFNH
jgi:hypothetical protein